MTFDPFGDFATRGYLRNVAKAKDPKIVQRLLHNSFLTGIDAALGHLKARLSTLLTANTRGPRARHEGRSTTLGRDWLVRAGCSF